MSSQLEHTFDWNDRLQDWVDGDVEPAEAAAIEAHVAGCDLCRAQLHELQRIDAALRKAVPHLALDESFDTRLFARIGEIDEARRAAARRRVEQELKEQMQALRSGWTRTLAAVIPGAVAGVALAFALTAYVFSADIAQPLIENAETMMRGDSGTVQIALTTLFGAAIGAGVARWLAALAE
jgi:anti-sigma factor RsiW